MARLMPEALTVVQNLDRLALAICILLPLMYIGISMSGYLINMSSMDKYQRITTALTIFILSINGPF